MRADEDDCRRLHRPGVRIFVGKFLEHIALGATVRVANGTRWDAPGFAHKGRTLLTLHVLAARQRPHLQNHVDVVGDDVDEGQERQHEQEQARG